MTVIAITNQKGGVGKTTSAVALSAALADLGQEVLLIDADPQANATLAVGFDMSQPYRSLYDAMQAQMKGISEALEPTLVRLEPNWSLVPSHINLASMEMELLPFHGREYVLQDLMKLERNDFAWIIIDCPPSLGQLTFNALTAADEVLIPQVPDFISAQGLRELVNTIATVRRRPNPELRVAGVFLTKVRAHLDHHRQMRSQIATFCSLHQIPFLSAADEAERDLEDRVEIPDTINAAHAASDAVPLSRFKTKDGAGAGYRRLAQILIDRRTTHA